MATKLQDQVVERIYSELSSSGEFGEGNRLPSERELAERFDCSRFTVRSALSQMQRAGVVARVPGKGTILLNSPSSLGGNRSVPSSRVIQVGLMVINSGDNHLYPLVASGLRQSFSPDSWTLDYWEIDTDRGGVEGAYPELIHRSDAFVIAGNFNTADLSVFCRQKKPLIVMGNSGDHLLENLGCPYIQTYFDYRGDYKRAVEHLWSRGYRRPAIFLGSSHHAYQIRYSGFCDALRELGQNPDDFLKVEAAEAISCGGHHAACDEHIRAATRQLFDQLDKFDSLITTSFPAILGEANRRGLSLPDDFAFIAETSAREHVLEELEVTEMRADHRLIGRLVGQRLADLIKNGFSQSKFAIPSELFIRKSC